jgi:hypothetical protein
VIFDEVNEEEDKFWEFVEIWKDNEVEFNNIKNWLNEMDKIDREVSRNKADQWFCWSNDKILYYMKQINVLVMKNNYNIVRSKLLEKLTKLK